MAVSTVPTLQLEREIAARGYDVIVGFDEVGRGSLAGPVMVGAAAIRTADLDGPGALDVPEGVADSKMLTEHRRETIFESLKSWSASWVERELGVADDGRPIRVGAILDGPNDYITKALGTFDAPDVPVPATVTTKVKGDRYCATVATAAVIAKVTRDRLMIELGERPEYAIYEWQRNKGYGSAAHREAIAAHGPSDLHRISWHLG